ncbi:DEKNAAC104986 [Brettanomyces naardenensis]|uniref:Tyrosine--tRNA ligase n=1 Tax=Brettanomyces naardenensis TaxID=13370 RepID=A0A448YSD1_BRENA|nr:DEKNAAC104986 [Brettanomyces naardenensis]
MTDAARLDHVRRIADQFINFFNTGLDYAQSRNPLIEKSETGSRQLKNNYDWWKDMGMLEFLANYGRFIRVNQMLARDSIKNRLDSEQGIGFNEFTYQVLQAYDFYYLNQHFGVDVQVGGNDQYGNIVAGIDFISRLVRQDSTKEQSCYGLTVPLLTTASGVKFGKSAGNAIFIDPELTPSYQIYQFMYRTEDEDVQRFLYKFSMLPLSVIDRVVETHNSNKKDRFGQRVLAMEMCDLIHGDGEGYDNNVVSKTLYSKDSDTEFNSEDILRAFKKQNMVTPLTRKQLGESTVPQLLYLLSNGSHSKSEFRRKIQGNAVYLGRKKDDKIESVDTIIEPERLIDGKLLLLRAGKEYYIAELVD